MKPLKKIFFICILTHSLSACCQEIRRMPSRVPYPLTLNAKLLSQSLCKHAGTEEEKAWLIYAWIATHIKYDTRAADKGKCHSIRSGNGLLQRKSVCDGYSKLFLSMCGSAGIKAYLLDGYSKSVYFDPGDRFYKEDHSWNAVRLEGKWFLVDATFGAGHVEPRKMPVRTCIRKCLRLATVQYKHRFVKQFAPGYFCTDPEKFILNHDPVDPIWQLLPEEQTLHVFELSVQPLDPAEQMHPTILSLSGKESPDADVFVNTEPMERLITYADRGYLHDVRNNRLRALEEITLADTFYNSSGKIGIGLTGQVSKLNRAAEHCKEAISYLACQRNDIAEEYKLLEEKNKAKNRAALKGIQILLDSNNLKIKKLEKLISFDYSKQAQLKALLNTDEKAAERFGEYSIQKIKPAKIALPANDSLVLLNTDSIGRKRRQIDSLQTEITSIRQTRTRCIQGFVFQNTSLMNDLFFGRVKIKQTIRERIKMEDNYKMPVKELQKALAVIKVQESVDFRAAIFEGAGGAQLAREHIVSDLKQIREKHRANEKFIRTDKHLATATAHFDQDFVDENNRLLMTTTQMRDLLHEEKALLSLERALLKNDTRVYRKQNNALITEKATENERMRQEGKRLKRFKRIELKNNGSRVRRMKLMQRNCVVNGNRILKQLARKSENS